MAFKILLEMSQRSKELLEISWCFCLEIELAIQSFILSICKLAGNSCFYCPYVDGSAKFARKLVFSTMMSFDSFLVCISERQRLYQTPAMIIQNGRCSNITNDKICPTLTKILSWADLLVRWCCLRIEQISDLFSSRISLLSFIYYQEHMQMSRRATPKARLEVLSFITNGKVSRY